MYTKRINRTIHFISQTINFIASNGIRGTISRIQSLWINQKKYSYRMLLLAFPQKFPPSDIEKNKQAWLSTINSTALNSLNRLLPRISIHEKPADILSALRNLIGESKYYKFLDSLFILESVITKSSDTEFPLIQSAKLPDAHNRNPRKNILFITSQVPNPHHGGGNRIINFIKILSERNNIFLVTAHHPYKDDSFLNEIGQYCRSLYKIPYWQFGDNQVEIHNWLEGVPIDVVHYEWPASLNNYDPLFGRMHIFTYMEAVSLRLLMDMDKAPPLSPTWLDTLTQLIHALRIEIADTVPLTSRIAVTTKDGDFFRRIYPYQEYAVLNHGVNLDEFTLSDTEPDPKTLVFVGNFGHYPNVDAIIYFFNEIWPKISKTIPDIRIYLVGPNPPKELTHMGHSQQVIVTGGVPDVRPYIQKATICIAPLITGAGLRGKVIEYAALKRTFVATSIAMTDLAYEDGSDYLKADTSSEFAQRIIVLLKDDTLRNKMARAAYETTQKNYATRHLVDYLYRLYDHLEQG